MSQERAVRADAGTEQRDPVAVRHIWLPSRRSLCETSFQVISSDAEEINEQSRLSPVCGGCVEVSRIISRRVESMLKESHLSIYPDARASFNMLRNTPWQWAISALNS